MSAPNVDHGDHSGHIDRERRRLLIATSAVGGFGLAVACVPFIESMEPSARALAEAGPVDTDLSTLAPGALKTVQWRGKPVWILHRSDAMLASLGSHNAQLVDPASHSAQQPRACANATRSLQPAHLVLVGLCTHLGCVPTFRPDAGAPDLGADWPGGFYCPCHGSRFDLAGRVFRNVPAPLNLEVPPYRYLTPTQLRIGEPTG